MAMDEFLAQYYGTDASIKTAAAANEDTEKQASVELFMKLATEQNIDLGSMKPEKVNELYAAWLDKSAAPVAAVTKTAAEEEADEKKKKLEEAKKEHEEKKAQSEKVAEADFLGRVMAHAYCQEMRKIASDAAPAVTKTAEEEEKEKKEKEEKDKKDKGGDKEDKDGGKGHMPPAFMANLKHGSAIDQLGAERSYFLAKEAGIDPEEAFRKVAGVLALGLIKDSEKVASAPNVDAAVHLRALELLEKAGYAVTWQDAK
jgi:hypothetical protein